MKIFLILLVVACCHPSDCIPTLTPNVTVDINGGGDYKEINQSIADAPTNSLHRYVIYIRHGIYREIVRVPKEKSNITVFGDGIELTVISGKRSNHSGYSTEKSATLAVYGSGFLAMKLTVENIAGPENEQAVAVLLASKWLAFYQVMIKGYQDSLYVKNGPQFYRECYIYGTIDFIFGDGLAVFQSCQILARQAQPNQSNALTANGCRQTQKCGFSFHLCNITGDKDLIGSKSPTPTYLGRPWKVDSTTIFMQSYMTEVINSAGWLSWNKSFEKTLFYGEFNNSGPGAVVEKRVKWLGVHSVLDKNIAHNFTVSQFIEGEKWLPNLGVPYINGLV
ncbi:Plant invertase/pectin methylesterase inhibitor superfamily [Euphorbia peplus]|nr:Plant invertase/pectin methylesterase inhibitor superfamily [Euphorbia peplus]